MTIGARLKRFVLQAIADRHPREMKTLEARLRSRFQGGLVADIGSPELARIAIMELRARVNHVRQVAMFLAREMTESSLLRIGDVFGRSHTTVLHGCNKIEAEIKLDPLLASRVQQLRNQISRV